MYLIKKGWYRSYRGLAGRLTYAVRWKGWTPMTHSVFPKALKEVRLLHAIRKCFSCLYVIIAK